jgi:hypothetical protein
LIQKLPANRQVFKGEFGNVYILRRDPCETCEIKAQ